MTEAITKLNEMLAKILAYGPSRKGAEKQKKPVKKAKPRKQKQAAV